MVAACTHASRLRHLVQVVLATEELVRRDARSLIRKGVIIVTICALLLQSLLHHGCIALRHVQATGNHRLHWGVLLLLLIELV